MAIDLGGTITGEHGVGWLKRGRGSAIDRRIKETLDPKNLLNPGKKVD
jgi:glycolate oxidase